MNLNAFWLRLSLTSLCPGVHPANFLLKPEFTRAFGVPWPPYSRAELAGWNSSGLPESGRTFGYAPIGDSGPLPIIGRFGAPGGGQPQAGNDCSPAEELREDGPGLDAGGQLMRLMIDRASTRMAMGASIFAT
jgi:hypothetical protein